MRGRPTSYRGALAGWPLLFAALLAGGCQESRRGGLTAELLALSEEARRYAGAGVPPAYSAAATLEQLASLARERIRGPDGGDAVSALNRLVFAELEFSREVEDDSLEFMLLPYVLEKRRGSCLGLAGVYLALGERLTLPLRGVLVPGHFFLRLGGRNIELLRKGEEMPDPWYRESFRVPPGAAAYMRDLGAKEILAVFRFNLGNARRLGGDYLGASRTYEQAIAVFPDFAEAHANLGLARHLLGDFRGAQRAYRNARELQPDLPGLAENLEALEQHRDRVR